VSLYSQLEEIKRIITNIEKMMDHNYCPYKEIERLIIEVARLLKYI